MEIKEYLLVACKTKEQAQQLIKEAYKQGFKWISELSDDNETEWHVYKEKTMYCFRPNKTIAYDCIDHYNDSDLHIIVYGNYTLINFEDLEG